MHPSEKFSKLYLKNEDKLRNYIRRLIFDTESAQDVLQNTAMALWKKHEQYDEKKDFLPWAYRFAYNEVRNFYRKNEKKNQIIDLECLDQLAETAEKHSVQLEDLKEYLNKCLFKLDNEERELIEYRYCEDGKINDLAKLKQTTANALSKSLQKLRKKLHICVRTQGTDRL